MIDSNGNSAVTVDRLELLQVVAKNLEGHRTAFLEAQAGFREAFIKELDSMLADARAGRQYRRSITLPEPLDHSKDYRRVIRMLEMSRSEQVTITEHDFGQYVMDEWGWKEEFSTVASNYSKRG